MNTNHACVACDDVPLILDLVQVKNLCERYWGRGLHVAEWQWLPKWLYLWGFFFFFIILSKFVLVEILNKIKFLDFNDNFFFWV